MTKKAAPKSVAMDEAPADAPADEAVAEEASTDLPPGADDSDEVSVEAAPEDVVLPESTPSDGPDLSRVLCSGCMKPRVYETDGVNTQPVSYCADHLPENITPEMVADYQDPTISS